MNLPATVADEIGLTAVVENCTQMDGEQLGSYFEENWKQNEGETRAMGYLLREMKRKFKQRDRHKQVDGSYKKIRGFSSFEKWFVAATGKSARTAYYVMQSENRKHNRNDRRRVTAKLTLKIRITKDEKSEFESRALAERMNLETWALAKLKE